MTVTDASDNWPITVPDDDPYIEYFPVGQRFMNFSRSKFVLKDGSNHREQFNSITSYIDGSSVYGSNPALQRAVRLGPNICELNTTASDNGPMLPRNYLGVGYDNPAGKVPGTYLFAAGDVRANENPGLTSLHTTFVREHNRQCGILRAKYPTLNEELLFQEARKWVIAFLQHITFTEYVPATIGTTLDGYQGYKPDVDATVDLLFATALFRYGHSEVLEVIPRTDSNGVVIPEGNLPLKDCYFNPLCWEKNGPEPILSGMAAVPQMEVDAFYVDAIRNFLFANPWSKGVGSIDLGARNIQRGRDHGIPSYNQAREYFGLPAATKFSDITPNASLAAALSEVYGGDINKVDAYVGGLAEDHTTFPYIGTLMGTAIKYQYTCSRDGDRFYYENVEVSKFTPEEISEIQSTRLSDIVLRNTKIPKIQCSMMFTSGSMCPLEPTPVSGPAAPPAEQVTTEISLFDGNYNATWTIYPSPISGKIDDDATIEVMLNVKTESWGGFGFSPEGLMIHSDVYAGWVLANGSFTIDDYLIGPNRALGCEYKGVCKDVEQGCPNNILSSSATFIPPTSPEDTIGTMRLNFTRKLVTGDSNCDLPITKGPVKIVCAMGPTDAPKGALSFHRLTKKALTVTFIAADIEPAPVAAPQQPPTTSPEQPPVASPSGLVLIASGSRNPFEGYNVNWNIYDRPSAEQPGSGSKPILSPEAEIAVNLVAKVDTWAGFGFNTHRSMADADVIIALRHEDGKISVKDYKIGPQKKLGCGTNGEPDGVCLDTTRGCLDDVLDFTYDYKPAAGGEPAGTMNITFRRFLTTGDSTGCDVSIGYDALPIIMAMGKYGENIPIGNITSHGKDHKKAEIFSLFEPAPAPGAPVAPVAPTPFAPNIIHQGSVTPTEFPGYHMSWTAYASSPSSSNARSDSALAGDAQIEITLVAKTDSWVAVGFNTDESMPGSDVYMALRSADGNSIDVKDYKIGPQKRIGCGGSDTYDGVCLDTNRGCQDNVLSYNTSYVPPQNGEPTGTMTVTFRRLLVTGDAPNCDYSINFAPTSVVMAMGPKGAPLGQLSGHSSNHDSTTIALLGAAPSAPGSEPVTPPTLAICSLPEANEFEHMVTALEGRYKLYWTMRAVDDRLNLAIVADTTGWVGFGISKPPGQMVGSEAIVGWPGNVQSYKIDSRSPSGLHPDAAIALRNPCAAVVQQADGKTVTVIRASRKVTAGDNSISVSDLTPVVVAIGPDGKHELVKHTRADSEVVMVNFVSGKTTAAKADPRKIAHGVLMFVSWGLILQFGSIFARYAKPLPGALWFKVHRIVQFAGFGISVAGFILAIVMTKPPHFKTSSGHAQVGLTVMVLGIVQIAVAIFRPNPANVGQNKSIIRVLWEFSHWWIGRLALILAVVAIFLGLTSIRAPIGFTIAWSVIVAISVLAVVCLELYRKFAIDRPQQAYEFVRLSTSDITN